MLAAPLRPTGAPQSSQHRPASTVEDFNSLLPPPVEFVEGSSSGALAIPEGKYNPINASPTIHNAQLPTKKLTKESPAATAHASTSGMSLYAGVIDTTWPSNLPPGHGMHNLGNTCFLNSTLQCLLHTPPLVRVLAQHGKKDACRVTSGFCMSCNLRAVMEEAYFGKHAFMPSLVTNKLQVIAKHMKRGRQEDSHEFLRYAVDALQKSCLAGCPPKLNPKVAETTWVHKIFGGRLRSRVTCSQCHHNSDTFDSILDLSLDIHGVSHLREALHKFTASDYLKGADKYKCEKCKRPVNAEKRFTIHQAPPVLTVHLKRFTPLGRKIGHPVRYTERLELTPYMSKGEFGPSYRLFGIICHLGGGPNSGHYYAHVKAANGRWYEMNDDMVSSSNGAPMDLKTAYILFYIREKGQSLDAALSAPTNPSTNGVDLGAKIQRQGFVSGMKKRKLDSEAEGRENDSAKKPRPFIGPIMPSTLRPGQRIQPIATLPQTRPETPQPKEKQILVPLVDYSDDEDEDAVGEVVSRSDFDPDTVVPSSTPAPNTPLPPSSPVEDELDPSSRTDRRIAEDVDTTPARPSPIPVPPSSFYSASFKKRKSADDDSGVQRRQVLKNRLSSPLKPKSHDGDRRQSSSGYGKNPFSSGVANNTLSTDRYSSSTFVQRKQRRRIIGL